MDDSVIAFDVRVMLRLAWLDVASYDPDVFCSVCQFGTNVLRPIIHGYHERFTPPFDNLVKAKDDAVGGQIFDVKQHIYLRSDFIRGMIAVLNTVIA